MKIDPTVYQKEEEREPYDSACCSAHKYNEIDFLEECDHTSPWEN